MYKDKEHRRRQSIKDKRIHLNPGPRLPIAMKRFSPIPHNVFMAIKQKKKNSVS